MSDKKIRTKKPVLAPRQKEAQIRSRRRERQRIVRTERTISPVSSIALVFAEMLDTLLPGKVVTALAEVWVHGRGMRREAKSKLALAR
jgi:hypothetical protein